MTYIVQSYNEIEDFNALNVTIPKFKIFVLELFYVSGPEPNSIRCRNNNKSTEWRFVKNSLIIIQTLP